MLTSPPPTSSTALHCTPHLPTVNAQTAVNEPPSPLKGQVEEVEQGGARWSGPWGEAFKGPRAKPLEPRGLEGWRGQAGKRRTAIGSSSGWPVMPKDAVYDAEARQRRAFGGERRTVAVRRLDRGDR